MTLLASSGAFATFVLNNPEPWIVAARPVLALLAAALSAYSLVTDNQKLSADATNLHRHWNDQAKNYEALREDMYSDTAFVFLADLSKEDSRLSEMGIAFPEKKQALLRWQNFVESHHQSLA